MSTPQRSPRDRHGRGMRRSIVTRALNRGRSNVPSFEQIVTTTCEYLCSRWPDELEGLGWMVADAPPISTTSKSVRRWSIRREAKLVVIYRLPLERFAGARRSHPIDERMRIEEAVFEAVGALIDKDPWDLMPDHRH